MSEVVNPKAESWKSQGVTNQSFHHGTLIWLSMYVNIFIELEMVK